MSAVATRTLVPVFLLLSASLGCATDAEAGPSEVHEPSLPAPRGLPERISAVLEELESAPGDGLTHEVTIVDPEGALARSLRTGLERATRAEGTLRIAFFGSSHVASDLVTGFVRERLQRHFGDAGHGYVSAVPPYGDYWQWGAALEGAEGWSVAHATFTDMAPGPYGLTGMAFDALQPARAAVRTDGTSASRVELFFLRQPGGGELALSIDGAPHTLETAFERHAAGVAEFELVDGPHRVEVSATGDAPSRIYGFAFERDAPGVVVDQLGLNGITPAIALLSDEAVVRDLLTARRPDVMALWFGANEATEAWPIETQAARLRALVQRLSAAAPNAACLIIGPLDRRQHTPERTPFVPAGLLPLLDAYRRVALEEGCAYFDAFAWQGGEGAVERFEAAEPALVRPDRLHLSHAGYVRLGASLLRALLEPLSVPRDEG